jgi:uncharacterized protein (TIGR03382 family)
VCGIPFDQLFGSTNLRKLLTIAAAAAALMSTAAFAGPVVTANTNATQLANAIGGSGITISNAQLNGNTGANGTGTFTGGGSTVGFDSGIVLTTGTVACAGSGNTVGNCSDGSGGGNLTELSFDFTSDTGQVFFQYVFGSEEYNEFVNAGFNDTFELLLNGVNIALLPGGGVVSIDSVNCTTNSAFYRNNSTGPTGCTNLALDIEYDGLTVVLTASGTVNAGTNSFLFRVRDNGDSIYDSGVYIRAGSFSGNPVPVPGTLALAGLGLLALGVARRRA